MVTVDDEMPVRIPQPLYPGNANVISLLNDSEKELCKLQ